jgi:hypothetical protein
MALDLLADLTRLGRVIRRGLEGEDVLSSMAEEAISKEKARYAGKVSAEKDREAEKPKCTRTAGCIGGKYHEGGCILNAEVESE